MINSFNHAVAPGTAANRIRQARLYIAFALCYKFNFLNPTITNLSMYVQFLANSFASPLSVKNYMSGAKQWVFQHGGAINMFSSSLITDVGKGAAILSNHVPSPAAPLRVSELYVVARFLDKYGPSAFPVKAAVLIGFACFLRSSNLLSPSLSSWEGPHTLLARDVVLNHDSLSICIRSAKTLSNKSPIILHVLKAADIVLCPVTAWLNYSIAFNPQPLGPAFVYKDGLPLTPLPVVKLIRLALKHAGYSNVNNYSIHSIRRGAVQLAASAGATKESLKAHGTWRSDAGLRAYLNISSQVPQIIAKNLAP